MIQQTTALRKIAGLKKKIKVVQGGQGAGKTIAILILLINHAFNVDGREILVLSAELSKMRLTVIKDFVNVMRLMGVYEDHRFIAGTLYRFPNGSFIKFIGLDKSDVGKGLRSHVAYFNELNKTDSESYRQVASRTGKVYADFNPDAEFFAHTDIIPRDDCDFIKLTFQDNELLPQGEKDEIQRYKELGYNEDGSIKSKYWANKWQVYGLGNIGSIDGVVFENWDEINEIPKEAKLIYNGVDFGFSISKFASLDIYQWNGHYILNELVYETGLTNPDSAVKMNEAGYKNQVVYCDYAEPKSIEELRRAGIRAVSCESKNDIYDFAIQKLNAKTFYVTKKSVNLVNELRYWVYDEKTMKPKKSNIDHLMNALIYAVGSGEKYTGDYVIG
jgi:phage terminase large subunit